ncbi:unnamed protein product [Orchesella dallaii]|uniref:Uncharacterized protein n=1 Tax=Orchesella dallaii TaxID=48710 RepID=A0ABP1S0M3_9HEXA
MMNSIKNEVEKAMKFYQILMKRKDSYKPLILALQQSNQTGVLDIIQNINTGPISFNGIDIFQEMNFNQRSLRGIHFLKHFVQLLYPNPQVSGPSSVLFFKSFPWKCLQILYSKREFIRARNLGKEFVQILENNEIAPNDVDMIRTKYQIALIDFGSGNLENCCKILWLLVPFYLRNRNEEFSESEILSVEHRLALSLQKLGRCSDCLLILRYSFERQRDMNGLNHCRTIVALTGLANFLSRMIKGFQNSSSSFDHIDTSELELVKVIEKLNEVYEHNKHKVDSSMSWAGALITVASCLYNVGEYETATNIAYEVYDRIIKHWSGPDKELYQILLDIGETLYFMKLYQKSLSVCNDARNILEMRLVGNSRYLQDINRLAEKAKIKIVYS